MNPEQITLTRQLAAALNALADAASENPVDDDRLFELADEADRLLKLLMRAEK